MEQRANANGLQAKMYSLWRYQSMSKKAIGSLLCAMAIAAFAALAAPAVGADVPNGTKGEIVKVDAAKSTLTVHTQSGDKTYMIAPTTQIVGPRGGIVHKRLQDPRFHAGLHVTIVGAGTSASQVLLGVDHKAKSGDAATSKTTAGFRGDSAAKGEAAKTEEAADDNDNEFPGKIKSVDADKNILVVTLLTGKDHSFMVGSEAKLTIGARVSQKGLSDPALKPGATVTVVTEEGGKKVAEVKVNGPRGTRRGGMRFRSNLGGGGNN
jgi:hypothetical protein